MHQAIKILPPQLANQIAAGEVVERPASVVKELVENSLDADATVISIDIEQGGQKRILIRDNGNGIAKEDLCLALSRHATSKISSIDDLEHITSMGFRGEALASISSVSRLTLTSKPEAQSEAWQAVAEGQQQDVDVTPAAHPNGTSIEVLDLFFNTPARRKFLRTSKTEFQHIEQIIKRIALTRPDVQFVLSHNQKVHCRYLKVKELSKRIEQVCGKNLLPHCRQIDYSFGDIKVNGWCSELGHGVATRDWQYTFVNGRMMKDKLLAHALRQAYEDTLPPQTFSCYVLFLQVSPEQMDVNVHPAKHEVRFHQARQVHDIVFKAVNNAISPQGSESIINDEFSAHQPQHNYIQPLNASNTNPTATQVGRNANVAYRSNTPTKGEIKASNDFYASVLSQAHQSENSTAQETDAAQSPSSSSISVSGNTKNKGSGFAGVFRAYHYLFSPPFVVLQQDEHLSVVAIDALLNWVIRARIARSTLSQPLLMPISTENRSGISQAQLKEFSDIHMLMSISHQKIILKQVPSELRHLPWASIFSQINFDTLKNIESADTNKQKSDDDSPKCVSQRHANITLSKNIANAWLNTLDVTANMLDGWINEIGEQSLSELCLQHGKLLSLSAWMDDIHLSKQ